MDIKYGLDKNFSAAQLEKLFLSVKWSSGQLSRAT